MSHRWLPPVSLALALACALAPSHAQGDNAAHYDGTWRARIPCRIGAGSCAARVVIGDFQGTWQDLSGQSMAKRRCGGKKMPITVQSNTRSQFAFTVFGDTVSLACPTLSVLVKPVNDKTLEGKFEEGVRATESLELDASHSVPAEASAASDSAGHAGADAGTAKPIRLERR